MHQQDSCKRTSATLETVKFILFLPILSLKLNRESFLNECMVPYQVTCCMHHTANIQPLYSHSTAITKPSYNHTIPFKIKSGGQVSYYLWNLCPWYVTLPVSDNKSVGKGLNSNCNRKNVLAERLKQRTEWRIMRLTTLLLNWSKKPWSTERGWASYYCRIFQNISG